MKESTKVEIQTSQGTAELQFNNLQEAMERIGAANLEILRRWVQSLENICQAREQHQPRTHANERE
jgi:hypothetical protein